MELDNQLVNIVVITMLIVGVFFAPKVGARLELQLKQTLLKKKAKVSVAVSSGLKMILFLCLALMIGMVFIVGIRTVTQSNLFGMSHLFWWCTGCCLLIALQLIGHANNAVMEHISMDKTP